jgi:methylated-DNA-[protein]-cysteine S-methyltransferase
MAVVRDPVPMVEPGVKLVAWSTPTPAGVFSLVARAGKVLSAGFTDNVEELLERVPDAVGAEMVSEIPGISDRIEAYFQGDLAALDDIDVEPHGSDRKLGAWAAMRGVGPGTISYKQLAERMPAPASARSAARACATNPIALIVPCHRFVGSDGKMHGFYWGVDVKEWLVEHEERFKS